MARMSALPHRVHGGDRFDRAVTVCQAVPDTYDPGSMFDRPNPNRLEDQDATACATRLWRAGATARRQIQAMMIGPSAADAAKAPNPCSETPQNGNRPGSRTDLNAHSPGDEGAV